MTNQSKELNNSIECVEEPHEVVSISQEVSEVLQVLNPEQKNTIIQAINQEDFSGPIPHPELLKKYEDIKEGFAERIVSMAEIQLNHRVSCEDKVVEGSVSDSKRGQIFAFVLSLLFLGSAVFLGFNGHDWLAGGLGGGTLVSLVTVFITGNKSKEQ